MLALLLSLARADDAEVWTSVNEARLVAAMYGNLEASARLLQEPLDQMAPDSRERGSALYWLARVKLEQGAIGEAQRLLEAAAGFPDSERRASALLARLALLQSAAPALPVTCTFERDLCGLHRAWNAADKGDLELTEQGDDAILAWDTTVRSAESDHLELALAPGLLPRTFSFKVRATEMSADLRVEVGDGSGGRWASPPVRVPMGVWTVVEIPLSTLTPMSPGTQSRTPRAVRVVQLQDISGLLSTDRGPNTLLLDDLSLR